MLDNNMEKLAYRPSELSEVLGIGKNAAYALCHQKGFPAIRVGKSFIVPKAGLMKWLEAQCEMDGRVD